MDGRRLGRMWRDKLADSSRKIFSCWFVTDTFSKNDIRFSRLKRVVDHSFWLAHCWWWRRLHGILSARVSPEHRKTQRLMEANSTRLMISEILETKWNNSYLTSGALFGRVGGEGGLLNGNLSTANRYLFILIWLKHSQGIQCRISYPSTDPIRSQCHSPIHMEHCVMEMCLHIWNEMATFEE